MTAAGDAGTGRTNYVSRETPARTKIAKSYVLVKETYAQNRTNQ